jgi:hypothetical protein
MKTHSLLLLGTLISCYVTNTVVAASDAATYKGNENQIDITIVAKKDHILSAKLKYSYTTETPCGGVWPGSQLTDSADLNFSNPVPIVNGSFSFVTSMANGAALNGAFVDDNSIKGTIKIPCTTAPRNWSATRVKD